MTASTPAPPAEESWVCARWRTRPLQAVLEQHDVEPGAGVGSVVHQAEAFVGADDAEAGGGVQGEAGGV